MDETKLMPAIGSMYADDHGNVYYIQQVDPPYIAYTDGLNNFIRHREILENFHRVDNELMRQKIDHTIPVALNPNETWEESKKLLEMFLQQGAEITRRGVVAFDSYVFDGDLQAMYDKQSSCARLKDAMGFWRWSSALLNARHNEQGEEQIYIEVRLFGEIFKARLLDEIFIRYPDLDEEEALEREQLNFEIRYRHAEENEPPTFHIGTGEDEEKKPLVIDYDLVLGKDS